MAKRRQFLGFPALLLIGVVAEAGGCGGGAGENTPSDVPRPWLPAALEQIEVENAALRADIPPSLRESAEGLVERLFTIANRFSSDCCSVYSRDASLLLRQLFYQLMTTDQPPPGLSSQVTWGWNETAAAECEAELSDLLDDCVLPKNYSEGPFTIPTKLHDACINVAYYTLPDGAERSCNSGADCGYRGYPDRVCNVGRCVSEVEVGLGEECDRFDATVTQSLVCGPELRCVSGKCGALLSLGERCSNYGKECVAGAHCAATQICEQSPVEGEACTGAEVHTLCVDGSECVCPPRAVDCRCRRAVKALGESCVDGDFCAEGVCENGFCQADVLVWCMPIFQPQIGEYRAGVRPIELD